MLWQEALELFRSLQLPLLETTALLLESGAYLGAQDFERSQKLGGKMLPGRAQQCDAGYWGLLMEG